MKNYRISLYGFLIALVFYTVIVFFDLDLFERFFYVMQDIEHLELDELILPLFFLLVTFVFNILYNKLQKKVSFQKRKVFRAANNTYKQIIDDLLLKIVIHRISKEENYAFSKEALLFYQKLEADINERIDELTKLENLDDGSIRNMALPKSKRGVTEFV